MIMVGQWKKVLFQKVKVQFSDIKDLQNKKPFQKHNYKDNKSFVPISKPQFKDS